MIKLKVRIFAFYVVIVLALSVLTPTALFGCTIVSAVGADGQVWNSNNEDGPIGVANFINVFPKSKDAKYGYFTFSYFWPKLGEGSSLLGGLNEAGLTFDFNSIARVKGFDPKSKKAFPAGDEQILPHILATMSSVEEVISFFQTYWFQNGFHSAQMHVADRQGRFASPWPVSTQDYPINWSTRGCLVKVLGREVKAGKRVYVYPLHVHK